MADSETGNLSLSASEYFDRQCIVSSDPEDRLAAESVRHLGADRVVWASDFPHPDAEFPGAVAEFCEHAGGSEPDALDQDGLDQDGLDQDALEAVFWTTPLGFYRLENRFTSMA
jgi:predicted TIM-barrel fold metal-dependent hydrolase